MDYLVIVSADGVILEHVHFTYRDEAMYFVERRRKQGYTVTVKTITAGRSVTNG